MGEHREATQDILYDLFVVWGVGPVLGAGEKIFDSFDAIACAVDCRRHGDLRRVHVMVEGFALFLVGDSLAYGCGFRFLKGHRFAHVVVVERRYHVGVKTQHIAVANAVGDAVELGLGNSALAGLHVAHFLNGSDDKTILGVVTGEL